MQRWKLAACTLAVVAALPACTPRQTAVNRTQTAAEVAQNQLGVPGPRVAVPAPQTTTPAHRLAVQQAIANRVVKVPGVQQASVFVSGDTAYVAVQLNGGMHSQLAEQTKQRVISAVKSNHPEIRTVYVSANPDLFQHFQAFARDLAAGRPVDAIWSNFRSAVQRVWPDAR
ncbi:MAG: YhcN/YlaJ family sporulation lipoprotein [Alicyclobacillus sp.]|nr:YhcN/YlaJ family sporulation lipoprotein [Alicyclobacillus sp.]